jgi:hypothetical protein
MLVIRCCLRCGLWWRNMSLHQCSVWLFPFVYSPLLICSVYRILMVALHHFKPHLMACAVFFSLLFIDPLLDAMQRIVTNTLLHRHTRAMCHRFSYDSSIYLGLSSVAVCVPCISHTLPSTYRRLLASPLHTSALSTLSRAHPPTPMLLLLCNVVRSAY